MTAQTGGSRMETGGRGEGPGPGGDEAMILVVEDEPRLRRIILEILSAAGFRCVGAGDAESALELAAKAEMGTPCGQSRTGWRRGVAQDLALDGALGGKRRRRLSPSPAAVCRARS